MLAEEDAHIPVLRRSLGSWHVSIDRKPLRAAELTARYEAVATSWTWRLDQLGMSAAYAKLMRQLLNEGPLRLLPAGSWVLDAGTGSGALSLALDAAYKATRPDPPLLFSAVDRTPAMLQTARDAFDVAALDVKLQRADITELPYADGTFDFAMAGHVIEHLPDPRAGIQELARVLQPGAPLLLLTTPTGLLGTLVHLHWRVHRISRPDLCAWLQAGGFEDVQFIELPVHPGADI